MAGRCAEEDGVGEDEGVGAHGSGGGCGGREGGRGGETVDAAVGEGWRGREGGRGDSLMRGVRRGWRVPSAELRSVILVSYVCPVYIVSTYGGITVVGVYTCGWDTGQVV